MSKKIKKSFKKIIYVLVIAVAAAMLAVTKFIFTFIADLYVRPCPEYTEFGACKLQYGLSASVMGTAAGTVWVLIALTILIMGVYKLRKSLT